MQSESFIDAAGLAEARQYLQEHTDDNDALLRWLTT